MSLIASLAASVLLKIYEEDDAVYEGVYTTNEQLTCLHLEERGCYR